MDELKRWIEESPYTAALGVEVAELSPKVARFRLPYKDENSNPGQVLHGGVAASMVALGGQTLARAALGDAAGPWHTTDVQVAYLAAAIGEPLVTEARLLRQGREICFVSVDVETAAQKPIAQGLVTVRGRFGAAPTPPPKAQDDGHGSDPGPMGPHVTKVPFIHRLGLQVEHMAAGRSRLVMPFTEPNADAGGGVHEGAVLALLDTTGAMAAWAVTGPGPYKASTPGIQAQILVPPDDSDLVGCAQVLFQDNELFLVAVEVARADDRRLVARGTVHYRIVVPKA